MLNVAAYILRMKYILEEQMAECSSTSFKQRKQKLMLLYLFTDLFCKDVFSLLRIKFAVAIPHFILRSEARPLVIFNMNNQKHNEG